MKVFVAGGSGVIGRRLIPLLVAAGHQVTAMTRDAARGDALRSLGATVAIADVFDAARLGDVFSESAPDMVVHQLTSLPRAIDPRKIRAQLAANDRVRTEGTRNVMMAALASGVRKVVAQSVAFEYAPEGPMVKHESDRLWDDAPGPIGRAVGAIHQLERAVTGTPGIDGVVLRYGYFYGPGTTYAPDGQIVAMVRKRRFPLVGRGEAYYSFIHIDDAAEATMAALGDVPPGVYNIVDDEPAPTAAWLPALADAIGAPAPRHVPLALARVVGGRYGVYLMAQQRGASNARAAAELGWHPQHSSWRSGFAETLA